MNAIDRPLVAISGLNAPFGQWNNLITASGRPRTLTLDWEMDPRKAMEIIAALQSPIDLVIHSFGLELGLSVCATLEVVSATFEDPVFHDTERRLLGDKFMPANTSVRAKCIHRQRHLVSKDWPEVFREIPLSTGLAVAELNTFISLDHGRFPTDAEVIKFALANMADPETPAAPSDSVVA